MSKRSGDAVPHRPYAGVVGVSNSGERGNITELAGPWVQAYIYMQVPEVTGGTRDSALQQKLPLHRSPKRHVAPEELGSSMGTWQSR